MDNSLLRRDGTSQAQRLQPALDPEYVAIDERSLKDLLAFARKYARDLRYFGVDEGQVADMGDWSAFLSDDLDLDAIIAYIQEPERFSAEEAAPYPRPHFALFLTFLQLLRPLQDQLNQLTRRHLDFYYQQALRMTKKAGIPDRVNVLVELADDTDQYLLPGGTLLAAGTDSLGNDLFYSTQDDLVVNHAQVTQMRSLFAEKRVIDIRKAREEHDGPQNESIIRMLEIALGDPLPGDPLPLYANAQSVDYDFLLALRTVVDFVDDGLFMTMLEFYDLIDLKLKRDQSAAEWDDINRLLEKAMQRRTGDDNARLDPADPRDFDANLIKALGGMPNFDGITEVEDIYDLYDQRTRLTVQQFIQDALYFASVNDFVRMMQTKVRIDKQWDEIKRILTTAASRKHNDDLFTLPAESGPPIFENNLEAALGPLTYPTLPAGDAINDLDAFYLALQTIAAYFFMPAEDFGYIMTVAEKETASAQEWDRVYDLLTVAHQDKVYAARRIELQQIREAEGFESLLRFAVGDASSQTTLSDLDRLAENIRSDVDREFLYDVNERVQTGRRVRRVDWEEVYVIVERAQRLLRSEPVAQKIEWINLYPAADATSVVLSPEIADDESNPRWHTFGTGRIYSNEDEPPPPVFGWAVTSPMLALSQGTRIINLTLGFDAAGYYEDDLNALLSPPIEAPYRDDPIFVVQISTEKGWITPNTMTISQATYNDLPGIANLRDDTLPGINFELTFAENVDALVPAPHTQIDSEWPVLRIMLAQNWRPLNPRGTVGYYMTHYQPLSDLRLRRVHLNANVINLTPAQMQNDETTLEPGKPFEPFGSTAVAGTRFYLTHPELGIKKLDSLTFHIDWMGVPNDNLATHYKNYPGVGKKDFSVQVSLVDERVEVPFKNAQAAALFASKASAPQTITIADVPADLEAGRPGYRYRRDSSVMTDEDVLRWDRYLQWELNDPGFHHDTYPTLVTENADKLSTAIARGEKPAAGAYQINPPYTPKIKRLILDYTASAEIQMETYLPGKQVDRVFHIQPFGYNEIQPNAITRQGRFLPNYADEGELYIGIQNANPPQNLSLLFQMAEGSANPDLETAPIRWSYLSGNQWVSLDNGNVLRDSTLGLINSGIIIFSLDPAQPNTLLPPDLYWVRASVPFNSQSICDTITIRAQAVAASFVDHDNAPDHLSRPLPVGSITAVAESLPEIAGIEQPYTSVGGMMPEQDAMFYTRISERLRHKNRGLTMWDYEHMVLEQFPEVYKVKCLPPDPATPGDVTIIVIPDIRNKLPFNPFEPKAPSNLIARIEAYLVEYIPAFATITVKNAHYVPVKVRFAVRLRPGYNEGYYQQLLNDEINRFLSPWAYDNGADIVIGTRIYANVIINFIEERPYVDFVAEIKLFTSEDGRTYRLALPTGTDGYWVETDRPDGVLVAARQHEIDMIVEDRYEAADFRGINYMKVELDFIVG